MKTTILLRENRGGRKDWVHNEGWRGSTVRGEVEILFLVQLFYTRGGVEEGWREDVGRRIISTRRGDILVFLLTSISV